MDHRGWCKGVPYRLVKQYDATAKNDYFALELFPQTVGCRPTAQEKMIYRIRVTKPHAAIHLYVCPSSESLELLVRGQNKDCSGEFHYYTREDALR